MSADAELEAMGKVVEAIKDLPDEEKKRVLNWAAQKFAVVAKGSSFEVPRLQSGDQSFDLSTDTIATILGANSGPEVAIAAAANLHFSQGKQRFSRHELIAEMRTAPAHFKETFVNNFTKYLSTLTKADRLRLVAQGTYALSSKERQQLESKLKDAQ